MFLSQLIYTSNTENGMNTGDIENILSVSKKYNSQENISGILLFDKTIFIQVLEGDRKKICDLYHKIISDHRHQDILLIGFKSIFKRDFSKWSMGYISHTHLVDTHIMEYSCSKNINSEQMTYDQLRSMLIDLSKITLEID